MTLHKRLLVVLAIAFSLSLGVIVPAAWAWWTDTATVTSTVTAATLQPPTALRCTNNTLSTPTLSWTAPASGPAPQQYAITIQGTGLISGVSSSATSTTTSWRFSTALTALGTYNVTIQSQLYNWKSTALGPQAVTVTAVVANLGVASCG